MRLVKPHFSCVNNVYKVLLFYGGVPEWFNGAVPKTAVFTGLVSSNLTPSAFARRSGELRRTSPLERAAKERSATCFMFIF